MNKLNISWLDEGKNIALEEMNTLFKDIAFEIPILFKDIIQNHDGATPSNNEFKYFDSYLKKKLISGIGAFIPVQYDGYPSLINYYTNPPEFFPKNIVAFADTGGGDLICFDYRHNPETNNPPIVYWNHEAENGKDVSFIANNFEEFLEMLREPES